MCNVSVRVAFVFAFCWIHTCAKSIDAAWLTGNRFRAAINRPIGVTWADTPIRDALNRLAESQDIAIFLDRRVDPSLPITASSDVGPFSQTLMKALRPYRLGVGYVGSVVYVGPKQTAARIGTLAEIRNEKARSFDVALRKALLTTSPLDWADLSEPAAIVADVAEEAGMEFGNLDVIPHDLWPAAQLPPLTLSEKMTLVLAGFSMNFTFGEHGAEDKFMVTRFPVGVSIQRSYPAGEAPVERIAEIESLMPQAVVTRSGAKLVVRTLTGRSLGA